MPAVVVPASSAHFEGGELLLYAMARKGCTIWHRALAASFLFLRHDVVLLSTRRGDGALCAHATPSKPARVSFVAGRGISKATFQGYRASGL